MSSSSRRPPLRITGRILYLTQDLSLLRAQLDGTGLSDEVVPALLDKISTDELSPAWACFYYDDAIGTYCLAGLRGGVVGENELRRGGFECIVSGFSKGCGSSREQAPYAELCAGVKLVIAKSFEKIYQQNAQNIGLLTSTDFSLLDRIRQGEQLPIELFSSNLDPISSAIVEQGGLFAYNRQRLAGKVSPPSITTKSRAMTLVEKIIAEHVVVDASLGEIGIEAVAPGDSAFVHCDLRFSHEYVTPMSEAIATAALGQEPTIADPSSVVLFRDHLTFLGTIMPEDQVKKGLLAQANSLASSQHAFAQKHRLSLFGETSRNGQFAGSEAICHNKVIESLGLPGQVIVGTDSHTCMAGALGCFAFGVGATDMASAWITQDVRVRVPETIRIRLHGRLSKSVCAKDLMLHLLSLPFVKSGRSVGKVFEFCGDALEHLNLDERATLTNMSVEGGAFTGIIEADKITVLALSKLRSLPVEKIEAKVRRADPGATYAEEVSVELPTLQAMVALPGDPRNGISIEELLRQQGEVPIDIAYGGSCTGAKCTDMDMYASVLAAGLARGVTVASHVKLFIQFGSQLVREYALQQGYLDIFERAGASLIEPSCGACIRAGPGVSSSAEQVTISAINRNFPGRSGPGKVYLASPMVVAASALSGFICGPERYL